MKKTLKATLSLLFSIILLSLGYHTLCRINHKNEVSKNIKNIPKFSYQNIMGGIFTNQKLNKGIPTIFIYFNAECEFCNTEAKMIKDNIREFNEIQLVFVSSEKPEIIKKFAHKHQLTTYDNIHFLCDDKVNFAFVFDVTTLPCLILYDKNQKLIEKIKGQIKAKTLLKKLNQG